MDTRFEARPCFQAPFRFPCCVPSQTWPTLKGQVTSGYFSSFHFFLDHTFYDLNKFFPLFLLSTSGWHPPPQPLPFHPLLVPFQMSHSPWKISLPASPAQDLPVPPFPMS